MNMAISYFINYLALVSLICYHHFFIFFILFRVIMQMAFKDRLWVLKFLTQKKSQKLASRVDPILFGRKLALDPLGAQKACDTMCMSATFYVKSKSKSQSVFCCCISPWILKSNEGYTWTRSHKEIGTKVAVFM